MKQRKLETAIRAGDLDKVRKLIAAGVDVSAAFDDGTTPIQLAARERQVTILRALAGAGAGLTDLEVLNFQERLTLFFDSSLDLRLDDDLLATEELAAWAEKAVAEKMDPKMAAEIAAYEGAIFRAIRTGDMELLKERIAAGDDVNQVRDITLDTPLTRAVQEGDEEMVGELLKAGANVDYPGFSTPLCFALPDLRLVKILLDAGADLYGRGLDRRTPLERAIHRTVRPSSADDSLLLVRFFLEAGVHPPNCESVPGELLMEVEYDQAWELYQELLPHYPDDVARENFEEIEFHRDMNEADGGSFQWSMDLRHAAREGDLEELRALLEKGQGQGEVSAAVGEALREAVSRLELEAARVLIAAGADLDAARSYEKRRGSTPLAVAAESWHRRSKEAMRLLLDAGAEVDGRGSFGRTPLMHAVRVAYRHGLALKKAVPLLLAAGADPNLVDDFGHSAWTLARAPLVEAEERARFGDAWTAEEPFFDGPDLSELMSDAANRSDQARDLLQRCRQALKLLAAAGAEPRGEAELRLVMAATAGDGERVAELLAAGASADARATDGQTAIVAAAESGDSDVVAHLIAAGCDVDAHLPAEPSALAVAVRRADATMTRQLIDAGANVFMMMTLSRNVLKDAEAAGGSAVVEMVRGALPPEIAYFDQDVEAEIAADDLTWESRRDLPRQAALGDLAKVRELLAVDGVEVNGFDAVRRTALSAAAEAGHVELVRELIAAGADVNLGNDVIGSPRSTPLVCAAISSSAERDAVLRLLLAAGAGVDQLGADGRTALMHAVERDVGFFGRIGEFALSTRTLIAAGADLEIRDPYGLTAWMRAMSLSSTVALDEVPEQYQAIADLLAEAGASTDRRPDVELLREVMMWEPERVREHLAAGGDANARRHDGATALMLAVRDGQREIVELLLAAGADADARQWLDRGPRAIDAAVAAGHQKLVQVLVAAGASLPADRG